MAAKEHRAFLKSELAQKGYACIGLSLNVPGYPKSNQIVKAFFDLSLTDLKYHLMAHRIEVLQEEAINICDAAGNYYLVPCLKNGLSWQEIKRICEMLEVTHPLGRFIDVDLFDDLGNAISSGKSKSCFLCGSKPAIECRRERVHTEKELQSFMFSTMEAYLKQQRASTIAKRLSAIALKALLYEISLTPKPGLVDKFSSGSHSDMDYLTFLDSSAAISAWFEELAIAGFAFQEADDPTALPLIRQIGLRMETAMFKATGNINTQKGLIFLMGLCLFACGHLFNSKDHFDTDTFRAIVKSICKDMVRNELSSFAASGQSHGEVIFQKYGYSGARGEAESGFETVFEFGLPQLVATTNGNDSGRKKCFLAIAAHNMDTNILYRRGKDILSDFQNLCRKAFEDFNGENYNKVIEFCWNENISPGGSADLLAISIFIQSVMVTDWGESVSH